MKKQSQFLSRSVAWFVQFLSEIPFLKHFLPRWMIFAGDLVFTVMAYWMTLGMYRVLAGYMPDEAAGGRILLTTAVYGMMEVLFRVYRRTVRFSGVSDIVRLLASVSLGATTLLVIMGAVQFRFASLYLTPSFILIHAACTFLLLFMLRVMVKYLYYMVTTYNQQRQRVMIYSADGYAISMAQYLAGDTESEFKPVALLCRDESRMGLRLGSIPLIRMPQTPQDLVKVVQKQAAQGILFREEHLKELSKEMIDGLLEAKIKLYRVGELEDYSKQKKKKRVSVNEIRIEDLLDREVIKTDNSVVAEKHRDRVVLVTGAAGSIGSEVVRQVAAYKPSKLILLDQAESPLYDIELHIKKKYPALDLVVYIADVRHQQRMVELFETYRPEVIYHAAAYKHVPMMERYPAEAIRVNVMGTRMVADLAVRYEARKFVMVSTDKAVNPTNVMGASKRIAEIYVQSLFLSLEPLSKSHRKRTRFITTRFGNVLGSNGSVVPLFKDQIAKGGPVTVTHKDIIRYFMTIPEACRLVLEAGCMGRGGEIFVFDMGEPVRIYDLAKRMILLSGLQPFKDIDIVESGLRPGEKLYEELLNDEELTLPTHHEKIMVAKVREYLFHEVQHQVDELIGLALIGDNQAVVKQMKQIVPEFVSQNSIYEVFDEKKTEEVKSL